MNRGGTSAPLDDELGRVGFGIGNKRLTDRATLRFKVPATVLINVNDKRGLRWGQTWFSVFKGGFAGVRLGFRFSTESQTAARKTQPKCSQLNRDGTSAPLDE